MTLQIGNRYEILDGPSEDRLFASFRYKPCPCCGKSWNDYITFWLPMTGRANPKQDGNKRHGFGVRITSIGRDDESGEAWNIAGYLMIMGETRFKGYYSTRTHSGHLVIQ
jgi:hypothetical protein